MTDQNESGDEFAGELLEALPMEPTVYVSTLCEYKDKEFRPYVKATISYPLSAFESIDEARAYLTMVRQAHLADVKYDCHRLNTKDGNPWA